MLRRCLQLHLSLIVLADQTPRKAWPFRPPPGGGFGLDGRSVSEGLLLMDVSLIVAERGVQIVARHRPFRRQRRHTPAARSAGLLGENGVRHHFPPSGRTGRRERPTPPGLPGSSRSTASDPAPSPSMPASSEAAS